MATGIELGIVADMQDLGSGSVKLCELNDGTANNRVSLEYSGGDLVANVFSGGASQANLTLGTWPSGVGAFYISAGLNYVKAGIVGQTAQSDLSALFPTMTNINFFGSGIDANDNMLGRGKEVYFRTGFLPNNTTNAEMLTLLTARKAVYV
jgi:hypothetical protein